ncbi:AraC-like DNA-binding protein [Paenibacillus phyllosphaerae]|uniref:AraC-like DNA-binding protein n=1 Tax=Paenibacillus phyllosphaerae TaxID=274593 RepID=A0A7W5B6G8_9BACL|nr:AraC family transcriptional regulator [Paenibacillus phyllosphaerae]MBB3114576.1 AraC-like DNA-binding protein [Paenibacillus phyllosphaerae]
MLEYVHDWPAIVYVHPGQGTLFIGQTLYDMQAGDLFLIPGNTIHRTLPDAIDPAITTALTFSPLLFSDGAAADSFTPSTMFEYCKLSKHYRWDTKQDNKSIPQLLDHLHLAHTSKNRCEPAVIQMLQQLLRFLDAELCQGTLPNSRTSTPISAWMNEALQYIDEHLFEDIHLPLLARFTKVSPTQLSQLFQQLIGLNVMEYIFTQRILYAKDLLHHSSSSISEIAAQCGFDSLSCFYKKFKAVTGAPPSHFRRHTSWYLD